ncbi:MAG: sulfotransferase [Terriglobia bacterium]
MELKHEFEKRFRWYRSMLMRRLVDFDPLSNLIVSGGPRSGSTWLGELIACTPRSALLFEPLMSFEPGPFRDLGFADDQPIPENAEWPEAKHAFELMLRGHAITDWNIIHSRSWALSFLTARRMVVKCVAANALLPWLVRQFDFKYQPIFLIRHPFAVVASQLKRPKWAQMTPRFEIPECRFRDQIAKHQPFLSELNTRAEVLTAQWCLCNVGPLTSEHNDRRWITVHYEKILSSPESELQRIYDRWGLPLPQKSLRLARRPSTTTQEATFKHGVERQLSKWTGAFSDEARRRMRRVLDYFGISIYDEDYLPRRDSPASLAVNPARNEG